MTKTRESDFHKAVVQMLKLSVAKGVMYFHCPNGEARSKRTGAKLKLMGVQPGVPDLTFVLPGGRTAFLELKTEDGRLSNSQKAFRDVVTDAGAWFATVTDIEEARHVLAGWGALKGCDRRAA